MLLFFCLTVVTALVCDTCVIELNGAGSPTPSPMMKQWAFSYSLLKPEVSLYFAPIGGDEAYTAIATPCRQNYQQDYIVSDINFFLTKRQESYGAGGADLAVFPFFAGAVVLPYNLPTLPNNVQLVLTRELIWRIWTRNVTNWNDSAFNEIAENKPFASSLPDMNITLVLQAGDVGNTVTIQQLLLNIDKEHNATGKPLGGFGPTTVSTNWGNRYDDGVDLYPHYTAKTAFAVVSAVLTTEGALGYAPLSYTVQAGLTYAKVINKQNQTIDPANNTNLAAALTYAFENTNRNLSAMQNTLVADNAGYTSYPLTSFYYLVFHKRVDTECELRRELFKFFNWILTSKAAKAQIEGSDGYALFDFAFAQAILDSLEQTTCQGSKLLDLDYQESSRTATRQAAISIAAILVTIVIIILATLGWKRNNRITKAAGLTFATCFLLGCILNYTSVFVWALIPDTDAICQSRYIIVAMGFTLLLGAMFAKSWEISKLFKQARTGDIGPIQELPWWKFCQVFFSVVGVNFLLLIILSSWDPPRAKEEIINELELIAIHACGVEHINIWLILEFIYFSSLILWGGHLAYSTRFIWEKYNYPNESKSILLSIYNITFCCIVLLPLAAYLKQEVEVGFFLIAVAIVFPTSFALFMVYGPKIVSFLGSNHSKGSQAKSRQQSRPGPNSGQKASDGTGAREPQESNWARPKSYSPEKKEEKQSLIVEEDRAEIDEPAPVQGLTNRYCDKQDTAAAPPTATTDGVTAAPGENAEIIEGEFHVL